MSHKRLNIYNNNKMEYNEMEIILKSIKQFV